MSIDEFVAKHGFTNTPAGERMAEDLKDLVKKSFDVGYSAGLRDT